MKNKKGREKGNIITMHPKEEPITSTSMPNVLCELLKSLHVTVAPSDWEKLETVVRSLLEFMATLTNLIRIISGLVTMWSST